MLLIFFGLPGAGKTYAARAIAREFNLDFHDGDDDLPLSMRAAIAASAPLADALRDEFFTALIEHVQELAAPDRTLVVAQTFVKEKYRRQILEVFPDAHFILVEASEDVREERLMNRSGGVRVQPGYARRMASIFEPPDIPHEVILNETNGEEEIIMQARQLLAGLRHMP